MKELCYLPFGNQSVKLSFKCKDCGEIVNTDDNIYIPTPDYSADTARDSFTSNDETLNCPDCGFEYEIRVWASYCGGFIEINELDDDINVDINLIPNSEKDYYEECMEDLGDNSEFDISLFMNSIRLKLSQNG